MRTLVSVLLFVPALASAQFGFCPPSGENPAQQIGDAVQSIPLATDASIERTGQFGPGAVYAVVGGTKKKIADEGWGAWVLDGGRYVAFSGSDGAGGYENEGQSLRVYDVKAGRLLNGGEPLLREYYMIDSVSSAKAADGRTAFVVAMSDGGLGAPHVGVVDPARGQVYRERIARITAVKDGSITIGFYTPESIETGEGGELPPPARTETHSLAELLSRPVIVNEPSPR